MGIYVYFSKGSSNFHNQAAPEVPGFKMLLILAQWQNYDCRQLWRQLSETEFQQGSNDVGEEKDAFWSVIVSHFMTGIFFRLKPGPHIRVALHLPELPEAQEAAATWNKALSTTGENALLGQASGSASVTLLTSNLHYQTFLHFVGAWYSSIN